MSTREPSRWLLILLAVGGGLLTNTAFPDRGWWPLAFVGVAALFLALRRDGAWWNALVGFAWGWRSSSRTSTGRRSRPTRCRGSP
ncbi:hypothetical protein NKG05_28170 [Oerskovia sp. M15]